MKNSKLDYLIHQDVEHGVFRAQNIFSDEYITPEFYTYAKNLENENMDLKNQIQKIKKEQKNIKIDVLKLELENLKFEVETLSKIIESLNFPVTVQ